MSSLSKKQLLKKSKEGSISFGQIVSELAKGGIDQETGEVLAGEGKLVQTSVGNIREVLSILSVMIYKDYQHVANFEGGDRGILSALYRNGARKVLKRKVI